MDVTEHSVTLLSIIIGLGLTEMLGNLHRLIRNRTRVTWDGLPVVWAATLFVLVINYWWSIYLGASGIGQIRNAAEFGLILIPPILLFLSTASALPHFDGGSEWNMRQWYEVQRKTFIVTFSLYQCSTWIIAIAAGTLGWNVISVVRAVILATLVLMLVRNERRWDWIGVVLILGVLVFRLTTQAMK